MDLWLDMLCDVLQHKMEIYSKRLQGIDRCLDLQTRLESTFVSRLQREAGARNSENNLKINFRVALCLR